jgi:hypothetical protein
MDWTKLNNRNCDCGVPYAMNLWRCPNCGKLNMATILDTGKGLIVIIALICLFVRFLINHF